MALCGSLKIKEVANETEEQKTDGASSKPLVTNKSKKVICANFKATADGKTAEGNECPTLKKSGKRPKKIGESLQWTCKGCNLVFCVDCKGAPFHNCQGDRKKVSVFAGQEGRRGK